MAFPAHEAGRAVSAPNLLLFSGALAWQWLIGVIVDQLRSLQWSDPMAFQATSGILALQCRRVYPVCDRRRVACSANEVPRNAPVRFALFCIISYPRLAPSRLMTATWHDRDRAPGVT
jgi:hypothetical protein